MKQISEREAKGLEDEDVQTSSSQQAASRLPARVARTAAFLNGFGRQASGFRHFPFCSVYSFRAARVNLPRDQVS